VDQIGVLVPSITDALALHLSVWRGVEWKVWDYGEGTVVQVTYRGVVVKGSWRAALNSATPQLELIESVQGPSIYEEWIDDHGYGLHHLGIVVESIDDAVAQMGDAGFEPIQSGFGFGLDGDGGFTYFDTAPQLGFVVEAIVRPERRREPLATFSDAGAERDQDSIRDSLDRAARSAPSQRS
jgi:hypothetical protein